MSPSKLFVTGATGFLGQRVVLRALERGHRVTALVRPAADGSPRSTAAMPWHGDERVDVVELDLGSADPAVTNAVREALRDADAVVHCAASMSGDDDAQRRDTVEPTRQVIRAMLPDGGEAGGSVTSPRLVLVSSLSVYGYEAMPAHTTLDETTALESDASLRDAYCRAKLAQEALAVAAAQQSGLAVRVLRPGVIYGPGRLWSARLGAMAGPVLLALGRHARLPLIHVDECALAIVQGAEQPIEHSDLAIGRLEAINLLEDDETTQAAYLALIRRHARSGDGMPRLVIPVPWGLLGRLSALIGVLGWLVPGLLPRLPAILRPASLHARAKPLRYSNARLRERLGWRRRTTTDEAIARCGQPQAGVNDS